MQTGETDKVLWGAKAIGQEINRSERQTFYLLETGAIPAKKVGGIWTTTRSKLRRAVIGDEEAA